MIVNLKTDASVDSVKRSLARLGIWVEGIERSDAGVSLVIGKQSARSDVAELARIEGVRAVSVPDSAHPRIDAHGRSVRVGDLEIGGAEQTVISGPCAVESEAQIHRIAARLAELGVRFLRGGAFKPRTSPYAFQGRGSPALDWLRSAADRTGMKVVTEVLSEGDVEAVAEKADVVQIGSRNMQNFALLRKVGAAGKPVLLKRSMSATSDEWLLAGEYLLVHGASGVVFCERGVRGFDDATRNLLDFGTAALLTHAHGLPVIVDPSHGSGRRDLVRPLAKAALALGVAGVMIEVHDAPGEAESDGPQALSPDDVAEIVALTRVKRGS